jgi:GDP-L-fucose synthase
MVTGGSGMLGHAIRHVVSQAETATSPRYQFVDLEDADLCDPAQTRALFARVRPAGVLHLAADVGGLYKNMAEGVQMLERNLLMNMHVMQCCHQFGVTKLVSCLSTCVFPEPTLSPHLTLPLDETAIHRGPPHPSNEAYAYAKRLVDVQSRYYRRQYGCHFVCLAPTNIFGPHDNFSPENSHVVPALIRKGHAAVATGGDFVVRGTGSPLRQFVFSLDLARLFVWAYRHYDEEAPLILAPDAAEEVSIAAVAQMVADACGYCRPLVFDPSYADGQFRRTVTNQKLRERYPEFVFTPLRTAIAATVTWYSVHHAQARL